MSESIAKQQSQEKLSLGQTLLVLLFFIFLVACLALAIIWGWFVPFDDNTPPLVISLTVILSIICILGNFILGIALKHYYYIGIMLVLLALALIGFITGDNTILIKEVFANGEANFITIVVTTGIASAALVGIMAMSDLGDLLSSSLWESFRAHFKQRKIAVAILLFLLAVIIFFFFQVATNLQEISAWF